jgi:hypothetical protein
MQAGCFAQRCLFNCAITTRNAMHMALRQLAQRSSNCCVLWSNQLAILCVAEALDKDRTGRLSDSRLMPGVHDYYSFVTSENGKWLNKRLGSKFTVDISDTSFLLNIK